jgi:hypothetical protein
VQQRPDDLSGDYEYDLVHEGVQGRGAGPEERPKRPSTATTGRQVELDEDMSYDEAHDFER